MTETPHEKIRKLREKLGWTQEELALAADLSPRTVRRVESASTMSPETRKALASALEIECADLLPAPERSGEEADAKMVRIHDGHSLLQALIGFRMYQAIADDTQSETTAHLIKAVFSAIDSAKRWRELSFAEQYDVQRHLSVPINDLLWRGWVVACAQTIQDTGDGKVRAALIIIDEKTGARATLADPEALLAEAERLKVSREGLVRDLARIVDGERLTIMAEHARRLGCTPEAFSRAMGSLASFVKDPAAFSPASDRAAESLGVPPEEFLKGCVDILRWVLEFTQFMQEHGHPTTFEKD